MINLSTVAARRPGQQAFAPPHFAGDRRMGREIYALMCPDWRGPSFVLEGTSGAIAYANWRGLKLLEASGPLRNGGRLGPGPHLPHIAR
jgi:hypothetical protein